MIDILEYLHAEKVAAQGSDTEEDDPMDDNNRNNRIDYDYDDDYDFDMEETGNASDTNNASDSASASASATNANATPQNTDDASDDADDEDDSPIPENFHASFPRRDDRLYIDDISQTDPMTNLTYQLRRQFNRYGSSISRNGRIALRDIAEGEILFAFEGKFYSTLCSITAIDPVFIGLKLE